MPTTSAIIAAADEAVIARAASMIRAGACVAFPTETVYGLGANACDDNAVQRVFAIKGRPSFDPLIVHIADARDLPAVARDVPPLASELIRHFWPGPLTLVLPKSPNIPDIVSAGLPSVAVRMPDHPIALGLIRAASTPVAAPSANPFGYISPTRAEHVAAQLGDRLPLIIDGGPCRVGIESTILSLLDGGARVLRHGGISVEALRRVAGTIHVATRNQPLIAPGQLDRHYAPRTPLTIISDIASVACGERKHAALLSAAPCDSEGFAVHEVLSEDGDLAGAAAALFARLRHLDHGDHARIYALALPETGLGRAIMDRLRRAAHRASP